MLADLQVQDGGFKTFFLFRHTKSRQCPETTSMAWRQSRTRNCHSESHAESVCEPFDMLVFECVICCCSFHSVFLYFLFSLWSELVCLASCMPLCCTSVSLSIYIYMQRERERERFIYIYTYITDVFTVVTFSPL